MTNSKLLSVGAALLALAVATASAAADEVPAPDPAVSEATPEPVPPAPEAAPVEATPESAASAAVPAPAPEAEALASPAAEVATPSGEPAPPAAASAEAVSPVAPAAVPAELGAVGYDEQGRPGRVHVVVRGDTLWDVSDRYLGTPWVWPSIWKDNEKIENPHLIRPGDRIWITPSEMRRVSEREAAELLAGQPAAPQESAESPAEPVEPPATLGAPVAESPRMFSVSAQEAAGLVTPEALEAAGSVLSGEADRVWMSQGDAIAVGIPEGDTQKGDQFTIFRVRESVFDPETGRLLGHHVDILGWAEIAQTHPESSRALIRESFSEIEIGDRLMPRAPMPAQIALQGSPGDVTGRISFFANKRTLMGTTDFVYLNRGSLDGLEVGSPLEVYREAFLAKETTRNEKVRVPERVVAQLLVVKADPMTAVAFVTHTQTELALGDRFRGAQE